MTLYEDLKQIEPFTLSFHPDPDGIYSASLLMTVFKIKEVEASPFGEYSSQVAVDLGAPINNNWTGICIDHHPDHPSDRKYKLYYAEYPCGLIIYNELKEYIPREETWKVVGSLTGDGQPERTPDEIWDNFPILLEERGILGKGQYKVYTSAFPLFYFLSSGINALARIGRPIRALEVVCQAKSPLDILDNIEVRDAQEQFKEAEESLYKTRPIVETIKNRYIIVKFRPPSPNIDITSYIASKISGENPGKTVIVINEDTGKVSLRGVLAKYVSNKLASKGFRSGGHPGYCLNRGTLVFTFEGPVMVEDIKEGISVLDGFGRRVPVYRIHKRTYNSSLVRIYPKYSYPIEVTPEHKILTFNFVNQKGGIVSRRRAVSRSKIKKSVKYKLVPRWKEARELDGSELLAIPKPKFEGPSIENKSLAEFIGWYISEGYIHGTQIIFTLNKNEHKTGERLIEIAKEFNGRGYIKNHTPNSIRVITQSPELLEWCKKCGEGAYNKTIPIEVLNSSKEVISTVVEAIVKGDGTQNNNTVKVYTISPRLMLTLRLALLKLGILPSICCRKQRPSITSDGRAIESKHPIFNISWQKNPVKKMWYETENFYLVPYRKEEFELPETIVYDITTNGAFDAGIVVHNCGASIEPSRIQEFLEILRRL